MNTTTIRVTLDTRDRLSQLASERLNGATTEEVITFLLDEEWKARCIAETDRWREEHPEQWRAELEELARWERSDVKLDELEGPYRSDDPEFIAAGGKALTEKKDVR